MALTRDEAVGLAGRHLHSGLTDARIRVELEVVGLLASDTDGIIAEARRARAAVRVRAGVKELVFGLVMVGLAVAFWRLFLTDGFDDGLLAAGLIICCGLVAGRGLQQVLSRNH